MSDKRTKQANGVKQEKAACIVCRRTGVKKSSRILTRLIRPRRAYITDTRPFKTARLNRTLFYSGGCRPDYTWSGFLKPAAPVNILQTFTFAISVEAIPFYKKKQYFQPRFVNNKKSP